ncbi:MAG: uroporphyrinogen decarboxylase [Verrucomicrobiota bacterium]|nr:uroporphyrinogen decarboxylase [Verrucomicrobiota bacterium]
MITQRERFLKAVACEPVDRPPVWLMRQAGRFLPEYRALRAKHGFLEMVRTPELATEVTLQPLRRYKGLDAAIVFSDILVIPEALGQAYSFREEGGIGMEYALRDAAGIARLTPSAVVERLEYVFAAERLLRKELGTDRALLGFAGAPWTLACYMIEGGSAEGFPNAVRFAKEEPSLFESLLEIITDAVTRYVVKQFASGVDAVQLFDSWAGSCPPEHYEAWSLRWIRAIIAKLPTNKPIILFAKDREDLLGPLADSGAKVLGMGAGVRMSSIRRALPKPLALQGNLAPEVVETTPDTVRQETLSILNDMSPWNGHIFNLGHGLRPAAKLECVEALVETVTTYTRL